MSPTIRLALTSMLALAPAAANAASVTGSGYPISDVGPSLGLNYIVRTSGGSPGYLGQVSLFAGNFAPAGWALANGQVVPINSNTSLFATIGQTYGGDGVTTFALPNLNGRVAIGAGNGSGLAVQNLGATSGSLAQTLTVNQLPPYGGATGINAGNAPLPIRQPSLALNYGVVTQGAYPLQSGGTVPTAFLGQVTAFAGTTLPSGVIPADGRLLPINQNPALFSVVGTIYGGNGVNTFGLPDLQGRAPTEAGAAPGLVPQTIGEKAGSEQIMLTTAQLPTQLLTLPNGTTAPIGGNQPFSIMQPSQALRAIIDVSGTFPSTTVVDNGTTPFLGEISWFTGDYAPAGWMFADGQMLSIATNPALFAVLGSTFGGNGITSFALPDLRDRLAVGAGSFLPLGDPAFGDFATLTFPQLPIGYPANPPGANNVPEPSGVALLLVALAGLMAVRPRRPA